MLFHPAAGVAGAFFGAGIAATIAAATSLPGDKPRRDFELLYPQLQFRHVEVRMPSSQG